MHNACVSMKKPNHERKLGCFEVLFGLNMSARMVAVANQNEGKRAHCMRFMDYVGCAVTV
jgi:hypothetical protein